MVDAQLALSAGGVSVWWLPGKEQRHSLRGADQHPEGQPGTNQNQDFLPVRSETPAPRHLFKLHILHIFVICDDK